MLNLRVLTMQNLRGAYLLRPKLRQKIIRFFILANIKKHAPYCVFITFPIFEKAPKRHKYK